MYDWAVALYDPALATATPSSTAGAGSRDEEEIKRVQEKINNLKNNVRK